MACDHVGGAELIEMAERHLRDGNVPAEAWTGLRFRYAENLIDGMWASILVEVERLGSEWLVTRLDRNRHVLPAEETGFRQM